MEKMLKPPEDAFEWLLNAWKKWPKTSHELAPNKSSVRIQDMGKILPYITMLDLDGQGAARYRLIGEQLKLLYTQELTGLSTDDQPCVNDLQVAQHKHIVKSVSDLPHGVIVVRDIPDDSGHTWHYKTLSLPLATNEGLIEHAILCGCVVAKHANDTKTWSRLRSFDTSKSILKQVQSLDIGGGAFDFPFLTDSAVDILPPTKV